MSPLFHYLLFFVAKETYRTDTTSTPDALDHPQLSEPIDEAAALEARRKRREAIRAKYRNQAMPSHLNSAHVIDGDLDSSTASTKTDSAQDLTCKSLRLKPIQLVVS